MHLTVNFVVCHIFNAILSSYIMLLNFGVVLTFEYVFIFWVFWIWRLYSYLRLFSFLVALDALGIGNSLTVNRQYNISLDLPNV